MRAVVLFVEVLKYICIIYAIGGLYGGRKTYMGNVIPLCEKHHRLVHTNKDRYMPMLIDMINERLEV